MKKLKTPLNSALVPLFTLLSILFFYPRASLASDCWLSVSGAGLKNGATALNAYSASEGKQSRNAQICWEQTSPDGTMHVLEGQYTADNKAFWQLKISSQNDGSRAPGKEYKKILGEGRVLVEGTRKVPYDAAHKAEGGTWIEIRKDASRLWVQNFHVARVASGIDAEDGGNSGLQFHDLHFEDTRQNFTLLGHPDCTSWSTCSIPPGKLSSGILIQNTSGLRYSKRHVRLSHGISKVKVADSHANAGFLDGDFAVGFDVENPAEDIEFIRCSSRANFYTISTYWNGDGFKSENETRNIRWIDCSAFDNADAGFDIKTGNAYLENIVSLRNNRNIRVWSPKKTTVKNANFSYAKHHGGESSAAGMWSMGTVECSFCTLKNNGIQIMVENNQRDGHVTIYDSILFSDLKNNTKWLIEEKGTRVELLRTSLWNEGDPGTDPEFSSKANMDWPGGNEEFNSLLYGKTKGYYHE